MSLRERIEALAGGGAARPSFTDADRATFAEFRAALTCGEIRAAERSATGEWRANAWVKQGILLGFQMGALADRKSTRLNSSHGYISYAVFCLKKKKQKEDAQERYRPTE